MTGLLDSAQTVAIFLLVLGVVIAFHELGHFLAAKILGVKVETFSLGFGPQLVGRTWGETEYRIALIPLGGYVRMAGDVDDGQPREPSPRDFDRKPTWARLVIMAAGPAFSALLAVLALALAYIGGREVAAWLFEPPRVGRVVEGSPADVAGLVPGDLVLSVDGVATPTWEVLQERILLSPGREVGIAFERDGAPRDLRVTVATRTKHHVGWIGAEPCSRVLVRSVAKDSPAERAGLQPGDAILAVAGQAPCSVGGLVAALQELRGEPVLLQIERGGQVVEASVGARWDAELGRWLVGISPSEPTTLQRHGPVRATVESVRENWRLSGAIVESVWKLLTGRLSVRAMSGPVELATITDDAAEEGIVPTLSLVALISLNLAIFNLLPVPILDGGRIAILLVEAARGRDLERRTKEWILQVGLVMIVALMVLVLWFDLIKRVEG